LFSLTHFFIVDKGDCQGLILFGCNVHRSLQSILRNQNEQRILPHIQNVALLVLDFVAEKDLKICHVIVIQQSYLMQNYMSVECDRCSASILSHPVSVVEIFARLMAEPFVKHLRTHVVRCNADGKQSVHHDVSVPVEFSLAITVFFLIKC
jgi:hypothetical protein